jgi:hypothetical protein
MIHEPEEEGQIGGFHALFVEGEDELPRFGFEHEVGVLHALCDAAIGDQPADVVIRQEAGEGLVVDVGVDGHQTASSARGRLKCTSSTAVTTSSTVTA